MYAAEPQSHSPQATTVRFLTRATSESPSSAARLLPVATTHRIRPAVLAHQPHRAINRTEPAIGTSSPARVSSRAHGQ
ncbi:hypothetical protein GCM10009841_22820 [Microlunatus panaciterrae]